MSINEIDTIKLSKEINDTIVHRSCVMHSCMYLAKWLIHKNRSIDAIRLIGRCSVHDISKIQNTEEFLALASIVDEIDSMHDIEHVLSAKQEEAIKLHRNRNSHHPEYYGSPNDMSDLDLLEMACDCHARSKQWDTPLLDYINKQQQLRFKFDSEHLKKLKNYCTVLVDLTKKDDYSSLINGSDIVDFKLKDSTLEMLENFNANSYTEFVETERLFLEKKETPDIASIDYVIFLKKSNEEIGYISLKCNAYMEYKIFENYLGNGYTIEALSKFLEIMLMKEVFINIKKADEVTRYDIEKLGFRPVESSENTITYQYKKKLEKDFSLGKLNSEKSLVLINEDKK